MLASMSHRQFMEWKAFYEPPEHKEAGVDDKLQRMFGRPNS